MTTELNWQSKYCELVANTEAAEPGWARNGARYIANEQMRMSERH